MRALSLKQPWLYAVLHLGKNVDNRCWNSHYRGPLLLHTSLAMTRQYYLDACERMMPIVGPSRLPSWGALGGWGCIVGKAEMVAVIPKGSEPAAVRAIAERWGADARWYMPEFKGKPQYGFVLRNIEVLARPIKYVGAVNLFDVPDSLLEVA